MIHPNFCTYLACITWLLECDADTELLSFVPLLSFQLLKEFTNDNYEKQEKGVDKAEIRRVCSWRHTVASLQDLIRTHCPLRGACVTVFKTEE